MSEDVEKHAIFYPGLSRLIHLERDEVSADASGVLVTHISNRKTFEGQISLLAGEDGGLKPISAIGASNARQKVYGPLAEIIGLLNELFGPDVREEDKIALVLPFDQIMNAIDTIRAQAANNDVEQFMKARNFSEVFDAALLEATDSVESENNRQTEVVKDMVTRLLENGEMLGRFKEVYGKHFHASVNTPPTT